MKRRPKPGEKNYKVADDPSASPAAILACIELVGLLIRIALALYRNHEQDHGKALASDLLAAKWVDPDPAVKSWRERIARDDRLIWDFQGPRWRAKKLLAALGEQVRD